MAFIFRRWLWIAAAASALMLTTAHAFETFGKLAPCHLCLQQREVYWTAFAFALVAAGAEAFADRLARRPASALALQWVALRQAVQPVTRWIRRPSALILAGIFLFGAGLASFHAGVEWKWWPGPTTCTAGSGSHATLAGLNKLLRGDAGTPPLCDRAAWVMLGLSMAGWNAIFSAGLAGFSLAIAFGKDRRP